MSSRMHDDISATLLEVEDFNADKIRKDYVRLYPQENEIARLVLFLRNPEAAISYHLLGTPLSIKLETFSSV